MRINTRIITPLFFLGHGLFGLPAFPGAEGWGSATVGGRGGQIIHVTSLGSTGAGTLRTACAIAGPKIIVFDTGGVINLNSSPVTINSQTTIAGQTAPGGVTLVNGGLYTASSAQDIIVRFIRIRAASDAPDGDCFRAVNATNVIADHCSFLWARDENVDLVNGRKITLQHCVIAEPAQCYEHYGTGSGWGNNRTALLATKSAGVTLYKCILAHAMKRVPHLSNLGAQNNKDTTYELINNVFYNIMRGDIETFDKGNTLPLNLVGNYYMTGPNASYAGMPWVHQGSSPAVMYAHVQGNRHSAFPTANVPQAFFNQATVLAFSDTFIAPRMTVKIADVQGAYLEVLALAGPLPRDSSDRRVAAEIRARTGSWISTCDVPPDPYSHGTGRPPQDTDRDGMPDGWEVAHGLDPGNGTDKTVKINGYDAIEAYLNELADIRISHEAGIEHSSANPVSGKLLLGCFPNPFSRECHITIHLPSSGPVSLEILDVSGRLIKTLTHGNLASGDHAFEWKASMHFDEDAPVGIYFIRLGMEGRSFFRKILHIR